MKSEWRFIFETRDFRFDREHSFAGKASRPSLHDANAHEYIEFVMQILPSEQSAPAGIEQFGWVSLTLQGSVTETEPLAYDLAGMLEGQIAFEHGDFRLWGGLVGCQLIPESPVDEEETKNASFNVRARFVEIPSTPSFDSATFAKKSSTHLDRALVSQFNETKRDSSPIRQFLGYFKVIESLYFTDKNRKTIKQVLKNNVELRLIFDSVVGNGHNYEDFIDKAVDIRGECAHLKLPSGYGIAPGDPAIQKRVTPYLGALQEIARQAIAGTYRK